jgi:hypothetical protein
MSKHSSPPPTSDDRPLALEFDDGRTACATPPVVHAEEVSVDAPGQTLLFCHRCGDHFADGTEFCRRCGARRCVSCGLA